MEQAVPSLPEKLTDMQLAKALGYTDYRLFPKLIATNDALSSIRTKFMSAAFVPKLLALSLAGGSPYITSAEIAVAFGVYRGTVVCSGLPRLRWGERGANRYARASVHRALSALTTGQQHPEELLQQLLAGTRRMGNTDEIARILGILPSTATSRSIRGKLAHAQLPRGPLRAPTRRYLLP